MAHRGPRMVNLALALAIGIACLFVMFTPGAAAATLPAGFEQTTVISGLTRPQDVEIAPNGRIFVAEKTGIIKTYSELGDATPTVFADLRAQVHNYSSRGLLSIVTDPGFPAKPYVYVYYSMDAPLGGTPPTYGGGLFDACPKFFDPQDGDLDKDGMQQIGDIDNCPGGSRISRLQVAGEVMTGSEKVLVEDFCQQFAAHGGGGLGFDKDGKLIASASDGSTALFWDWGQSGSPANPCGDPPGGVGSSLTRPTSEGGRLRGQDMRTTADPTGLSGAMIRIDPATGAPVGTSGVDTNAKRIIAFGLRDATRLAVRPGTNDIWVAERGGGYFEELNRVTPGSSKPNFGWPCYEGSEIRKQSDLQNLNLCESLYSGGSKTSPYWAYDHEQNVHPDDNCEPKEARSGSTLSGLAFYPSAGGTFPPIYRNALFFADRLRSCIWALLADPATGLPKGANVIPFLGTDCPDAACANRATDLEVTPQGDLLYIDQRTDVVQRIRYNVANKLPIAAATATPTSGVMPLTVKFSALGSTDPDPGDVLTYAWDLDGDNLLDDSTVAEPSFTYENPGTYTVTLQVKDTRGDTALATVTVTVADSGLRTLRFSPIADARVEASNSGTNYGTSNKLRTDGDPKVESLLRFNVTGIGGQVQSAKLRLTALADGTADGPALYSAPGGWTETGVKWSNRPAFGAVAVGDKGAVAANSVVEYDVKSLVTQNGELNLGLRQPGSDSLELASREDTTAARRPVLEVVYALPVPDPDPDPTPDPTPDPGSGPTTGGGTSLTTVPTPTATLTDATAPTLALVAAGSQRVLKQRGVIVYASCDSACTLQATATVSLTGASRALKLRGIVRNASSGKQVRLRLALSKKTLRTIRRALRRGVKLSAKVTVVATDAAGNSRKSTRKIRLKR
jgi:glucose/arabinose dehydrogenase/PKD repeat protein